jgi:hypothetical protein
MGLFVKKAQGDEELLPLVRGDRENSFPVSAGTVEWQYKKAFKGRGWPFTGLGASSERFDIVIRKRGLIYIAYLDGYQFGVWGTKDDNGFDEVVTAYNFAVGPYRSARLHLEDRVR